MKIVVTGPDAAKASTRPSFGTSSSGRQPPAFTGRQTTQASKFVYGLSRPVTAIREAESDLNPATDADATWLPLITTPPYPSYAGNMACIGASAARALQLAFGTNDALYSC